MVVYADVLVTVNLVVDYFLLRLCAVILKEKPPFWRTVAAAAVGAVFSLYIFLPQSHFAVEIAVRCVFCAVMSVIGFKIKSISALLRTSTLVFGVTFAFAGSMWAAYQLFKPSKMVINNSVVYFDISPVTLILSSVGFYLLFSLISIIFGKKTVYSKRCEVILTVGDKSISLSGIIDSGNSLCDPFTGSPVILVNENVVSRLVNPGEKKLRYRPLPCKTVTGTALLEGYRTDKTKITLEKRKYEYKNVIVAVSMTEIKENEAVLSPEIFT